MEIIGGKIVDVAPGYIMIRAGYDNIDRMITRRYDEVQIGLVDGRRITPEQLQKELFSLSDCDVTTAREYISYLIEFCLTFDVPTKIPLTELHDDVHRYVYSCVIHKKCCVYGKKAELHHVDRVGMGNNRNEIVHEGRECLTLCREHHTEIDHLGDVRFCERYHVEPVEIDKRIIKTYNLRTKGAEKNGA